MKHTENARKLRPIMEQAVNSLDDKTASMVTTLFGTMQYNGKLIPHGTRINWKGNLKRAAVDVWDTAENNPDNAPALWEDISYKDGFRIIPETITATLAFSKGEYGWWGDVLKSSTRDGNVHNPDVAPDWWEDVLM